MKISFRFLALIQIIIFGCESERLKLPADCDLDGPVLSLVEQQDTNCSQNNGFVSLSATGGNGNFTFSESNNLEQANGIFSNLPAGSYTFQVLDGNGCSDTLTVKVSNIDGVFIESLSVQDGECEASRGTISVTATGGAPPYQYQLDGNSFQVESMFSNIPSGTHTIVVKDSNDCGFKQETQVLSGVSYLNEIRPIIINNCAVSGCHNGSQFPNLTGYSGAKDNAQNIKSRTSSRSMPLGGSLSQAQINAIACWVDDGTLDN